MSVARVPVRLMRGGTSRGPVMRAGDLPGAGSDRDRLVARMLSGDAPRDGLGGSAPTERKAVVVFDPEPDGVVPFQVGSLDAAGVIDWSGTCGNMTATVLPFLSEEAGEELPRLTLRNRSTGGRIDVASGRPSGSGLWDVECVFQSPAGLTTGRLTPTGSARDLLRVDAVAVDATVLDIAHPYVLVPRSSFDVAVRELGADPLAVAERIRRAAAVRAGLATDVEAVSPALPRIAVVEAVGATAEGDPDIRVTAYSMGSAVDSVPVTCALCLAGGVTVPGAVVHVSEAVRRVVVRAAASAVVASAVAQDGRLASVGVRRSARTVMAGVACVVL